LGKRGEPRRRSLSSEDTVVRPGVRENRQFGPYRIQQHLGSGGMGDVYLAIDTRLGRQVALKFLPAELTSEEEMLQRFQEEARTASALNHPNILTIYDIGEIEGDHFIASEYIDGITLRAALNRGAIELARTVEIVTQVASALAQAHSAGIIHRDLKPGNIMIRQDGYVKVIDFGLAKLVEVPVHGTSRGSWTQPGSILGTVHYMSPEQARGDETDRRSDLWSLGVILYEMVAHKRPFEGQTDSHVIVAILDQPVPPLPETPGVPAELSQIIYRALEKDPGKRYQSAGEMCTDLRRLQTAISPDLVPPWTLSRPGDLGRYLSRAAGIVLALAVGWAIWWWGLGGKYQFTGPDWFQFESPQRITYDGNVDLNAISPDGKYLAYTSVGGADEVLHLRRLMDNADIRRDPITQNHCIGLTFSPDTQALYYVLKNPKEELGRLYRMKLPSGIPTLILENVDSGVTFSPDGRRFAFVQRTEERGSSVSSILVAATNNPADAHVIDSMRNTQMQQQLAWSPRGDEIAAIAFPPQIDAPTRPAIYLFALDKRVRGEFSSRNLRKLSFPVWLDGGLSLMFSGVPEGAEQSRLEQLHIPTRQFHELPSPLAFSSISATKDSSILAAVSADQRSSIWVADASNLDHPRMVVPQSEDIKSLSWSGDDIIFPSSRTGNVNLSRIRPDGDVETLATPKRCVEKEPVSLAREQAVIYSSNCGTGGDDFNLWRLDLRAGKRVQLTSGSNYDNQPDVPRDDQWVVYTSWPSNNPSVWKVPVSGGTPVRLSAQQAQAQYPFVSPDGKQIVCQIREFNGLRHVAILSLADGTVLKEPEIPISSESTPVRWSPDGSALEYVGVQGGSSNLWRQPLNGGAPRQLTSVGEDSILYFAWNRDGTKLAYIRGRADSDVMLFRRASRR